MKKVVLSLIALSSTIGHAGSMGSVSTMPAWQGLYAGLNAGYTFPYNKNLTINPFLISDAGLFSDTLGPASVNSATHTFSLNNNGFIGGGQLGYLYNFSNNFVGGVETDIQGIAGSSATGFFVGSDVVANNPILSVSSNSAVSKRVDYLGTFRGHLGYLFKPTMLLSATGGLSYGGVHSSTTIDQTLVGPQAILGTNWGTVGSYSKTRVGWTAGGNLEWMFRSNWSAKVEYLYYDLGTVSYSNGTLIERFTAFGPFTGIPAFTNGANTTVHFNGQVVRLGVSYHFA